MKRTFINSYYFFTKICILKISKTRIRMKREKQRTVCRKKFSLRNRKVHGSDSSWGRGLRPIPIGRKKSDSSEKTKAV